MEPRERPGSHSAALLCLVSSRALHAPEIAVTRHAQTPRTYRSGVIQDGQGNPSSPWGPQLVLGKDVAILRDFPSELANTGARLGPSWPLSYHQVLVGEELRARRIKSRGSPAGNAVAHP